MTLTTLLTSDQSPQPMRVLMLGEFGSRTWAMDDATLASLPATMKVMQPTLLITIGDEELNLSFESLDDFKPAFFTARCEQFVQLKAAMAALRLFASGERSTLDTAVIEPFAPDVRISDLSADDGWTLYNLFRQTLEHWTDAVLNNESFKKLEQQWLALSHILNAIHEDQLAADNRRTHCVVTLLNISAEDALDDFHSVSNLADCQLFERIYSDELGQFGGHPYHIINPMFTFGESNDDVELLTGLAQIAAAAQCVVNAGVSPEFFSDPTLTREPLAQPRFFKWRDLVENPVSRYITLSAGLFAYRTSYGYEELAEGIGFEERSESIRLAPLHSWTVFEVARSYLNVGTALASKTAENLSVWLPEEGSPQRVMSLSPERRHLLADLGINGPTGSEHFVGFQNRFQMSAALASLGSKVPGAMMDQHTELLHLQNQFARQLKMLIRESLGHSSPEAVEDFVRQWLQPFVQSSGLVSRSQAQRQPLSHVDMQWTDDERGGQVLSIRMKAKLDDYEQPVDLALTVA